MPQDRIGNGLVGKMEYCEALLSERLLADGGHYPGMMSNLTSGQQEAPATARDDVVRARCLP
jgi:hypothetical protein